jgi:hypothetical protein
MGTMAGNDTNAKQGSGGTKAPARSEKPSGEAAQADEQARQTAQEMTEQGMDVMRQAAAAGLAPMAAVSTNLTSELNNIDFRKMIGGPLQAAVDAQVASSLATVDFINKVGFSQPTKADGTPDTSQPRELVMVDFTHRRNDGEKDASGQPILKDVAIRVPLLAMLPIPSLRIEHVIIDFNVKLNSVESSSTSDALGVAASVKGGWGPVSFKVSASYQRKTATNVEVKKEYALNVNVKAVQDEIPAGLEKILGMLAA